MTVPSVDNTTLNNLTPNLDVGDVADPALRLHAFQYIYAKLAEIVADLNNYQGQGAITTPKIADLAITAQKLADAAVITQKIADGAVTTAKIADAAVTAAKILDGAVGTAELANGSVTNEKISDGSLTASKFVAGALQNETKNGLEIAALKAQTETNLNARGINVKIPFGTSLTPAKGDGIADDTLAIQGILDYAKNNKVNVFVPDGDYLISKQSSYWGLSLIGAYDIDITFSNKATFISNEDITNNDFIQFLVRNCKNVNLNNYKGIVSLTGNPLTRKNCRILWLNGLEGQTEPEQIDHVNVYGFEGKITHSAGESVNVALYSLLVSSNNNIECHSRIEGCLFKESSGRIIQLDDVQYVDVVGNQFENIGNEYQVMGLRILNGTKHVRFYNNNIKTSSNKDYVINLIQLGRGNKNKQPQNIDIQFNEFDVRSDVNSAVYAVKLTEGKDIKINNNTFTQSETHTTSRTSIGIFIEKPTLSTIENIDIKSNKFKGFKISQIKVNNDVVAGEIVNAICEGNMFFETVDGIKDRNRSIQDPLNLIRYENNYFVDSGKWIKSRKHITFDRLYFEDYGNAAPTTGTFNTGDRIFNIAPSELGDVGSKYIISGWICTSGGTPGTWKEMRTWTGV